MASIQIPPPTLQGVNNMPRAILPEPNSTPARSILLSILTVARQPDGQYTASPMFIHRGSNGEQFLKRFLAFCGKPYYEQRTLQSIINLFLMRQMIVASVIVSVTPRNPARVISFKSHEFHELLTSVIGDPSRLKGWFDFPQTVLSPFFISSTPSSVNPTRPSTYPALMLDSTLCKKRRAIWFIIALAISFMTGYLGGGCTTEQHCQLSLAFSVGGVVLSVLLTVQAILLHGSS